MINESQAFYFVCPSARLFSRTWYTSKSREYGAHAFLLIPKSLSTYGCVWNPAHMIFGSLERCRNELQKLQFGSSWDSLCAAAEVDAWKSFDQ